jgi:hypothetical protein
MKRNDAIWFELLLRLVSLATALATLATAVATHW